MRLAILLVVMWIALSLSADLHQSFMPDAQTFFSSAHDALTSGELPQHVAATFARVLIGIVVAVLLGLPLGMAMGRIGSLRRELGPLVEFVRGIPTSMLFPIFIVAFGIGETSKVLITLFLAVPIIAISAMVGSTPRERGQGREDYIVVHGNRIPMSQRMASVLWDATPSILAGIKIAISLALVVVIVTEMFFVSSDGIGWAAFRAYEAFDVDRMYVYIVVAGLLALLLNKGFDRAIAGVTS